MGWDVGWNQKQDIYCKIKEEVLKMDPLQIFRGSKMEFHGDWEGKSRTEPNEGIGMTLGWSWKSIVK